MIRKVFVDTNVFIYPYDLSDPLKRREATARLALEASRSELIISSQVVTEFRNAVRRKKQPLLSERDADVAVRGIIEQSTVVPINDRTLLDALVIKDDHHLSFLDALIVATAQSAGCSVLLSEDLNNGQNFAGVVVHNPFTTSP
jgi:predicted nucleic acid-binding protein